MFNYILRFSILKGCKFLKMQLYYIGKTFRFDRYRSVIDNTFSLFSSYLWLACSSCNKKKYYIAYHVLFHHFGNILNIFLMVLKGILQYTNIIHLWNSKKITKGKFCLFSGTLNQQNLIHFCIKKKSKMKISLFYKKVFR